MRLCRTSVDPVTRLPDAVHSRAANDIGIAIMTVPNAPDALVNYVLRHMIVKTHVCSLQVFEDGYTLPLRTVPDYNFIHVTRGRVVWVIDGVDHPLTAGSLVIVPPQVKHHADRSSQRITLASVHVTATLPGGQDVFELLGPERLQQISFDTPLDRYLRGAATEMERPHEESRLMLPAFGQLITLELFRHDAKAGLLKYRIADPLVAAMLEDLDKRLDQPVTLAELAARSGFSAQHLNRVFRKSLGVTPLQYLMRTRMERAALLLREDSMTIRAIGRQLGFEDPYYFSRVFSQHFGQSPQQYRTAAGSDSPSSGSAAPFPRPLRKG
jgi:AraC-like DNA-binding protein/quercetin dioxygenase-like cupin family protein